MRRRPPGGVGSRFDASPACSEDGFRPPPEECGWNSDATGYGAGARLGAFPVALSGESELGVDPLDVFSCEGPANTSGGGGGASATELMKAVVWASSSGAGRVEEGRAHDAAARRRGAPGAASLVHIEESSLRTPPEDMQGGAGGCRGKGQGAGLRGTGGPGRNEKHHVGGAQAHAIDEARDILPFIRRSTHMVSLRGPVGARVFVSVACFGVGMGYKGERRQGAKEGWALFLRAIN